VYKTAFPRRKPMKAMPLFSGTAGCFLTCFKTPNPSKLNLHTISIVTKNGGFVNSKTGEFAISEQKCRPAFQTERHFAQ